MATQLIKHLEDCAKNDAIYKPLEAQWSFDEKLIAKALQNVSAYFPHYSRHDESHSRQILVHIERLLGAANIAKLSATDTWLLLEAAYLHDIGMVVTDGQLNKDFGAIKKHVEKTKHSAYGDTLTLMNALLASNSHTASSIFATVDFSPLYTVKLLREIVADFYRSQHPDRAKTIIAQPFAEIGLDSPRTELIPARLFGLLGKICAYHGKPFAEVMQLPQQQVGIGTDDCHPRFVACLLRLGDLLDLDDNRFCPVMMKMAGDLPATSQAHYDKHLSIRHFRADADRIEIEAECPSYESYIETTNWFGWLREEVKDQMSRWFDIVPSRDFGLLPSVGDLKAHLKDWQVFSENERPHFTLDRERIFELLQGAGLYENKEQAMRELLQNAVDATLIRIWREHGEDCTPQPKPYLKRDSVPRSKETLDILSRYAIDVSIEKAKEEERYNYWRITITDPGTGISKDDLEFMLQMGSSKKNLKKRAIIDQMPIWMKPSGIFGIGFHSVFLLTDEVWLETRSIDTGETLLIRVTNPTDEKEQGNVYFRVITEPTSIELNNPNENKTKPWDFSNYGCQLSFIYKTDVTSIPDYYIKSDSNDKFFKNYDGLIDDSTKDIHIINLANAIIKFFGYGYLAGNMNFDNFNLNISEKITPKNYLEPLENKDYLYSPDTHLELSDFVFKEDYQGDYFYRGQRVGKLGRAIKLFSVSINLLDDEADKILTINRNSLKKGNELFNRVSKTIQAFFASQKGQDYYNSLDEENKAKISAEYELQGWNSPNPNYFCSWHEFSIRTQQGKRKIEELIDSNTILIFRRERLGIGTWQRKAKSNITNDLTDKKVFYITPNNTTTDLMSRHLKSKGFKSSYVLEKDEDDDEIEMAVLSKQDDEPITDDMICNHCADLIKERSYRIYDFLSMDTRLKRPTIPCLSRFKLLELDNPSILPALTNENVYSRAGAIFPLDFISPRMLFPLARIGDNITVGNLDILAKRVYKNRANKDTSEKQIKEKYQEFIAFLDKLMQDEPEWVKLRGTEFAPAEPESAKTD
ncbi:HD domain-containing protein [Methylovulum psychrotolerans]|uniref:HD-CE domain-containing protein n=1 Tax=Methylovulum psychrotolerans TaxID=1704499 RepID=A0A1Z4C1M6_9GAMM|nr:ATP-binding protein [Methylovulum psychrotolerans]ASF47419.1 hypothetical protein CEK71_15875 [Methylovulum psychrotolerans]